MSTDLPQQTTNPGRPWQTRASFDAALVLRWLESDAEPVQGWRSVAEEACQRLLMIEEGILVLKDGQWTLPNGRKA